MPCYENLIQTTFLFDQLYPGHLCETQENCYVQNSNDDSEKTWWPDTYNTQQGNVIRMIARRPGEDAVSITTSQCSTETAASAPSSPGTPSLAASSDETMLFQRQIPQAQPTTQSNAILQVDRWLGAWWQDTGQQILDRMHNEAYVANSYTMWKLLSGELKMLHSSFPFDIQSWIRQVITQWHPLAHQTWNSIVFRVQESMFFLPGDFVIGILDDDATAVHQTQAACLLEVIFQFTKTCKTFLDVRLLPAGATFRKLLNALMHPMQLDRRTIEIRVNDQLVDIATSLHPTAGDYVQILIDRTVTSPDEMITESDDEEQMTQLRSWISLSDRTYGSRALFLILRQDQPYLVRSPYYEFFIRPYYREEHLDTVAQETWQDLRYNRFKLTDVDPRYMGSVHLGRYGQISLVIEDRPWIAFRLIVIENEGLPQFQTFEEAVYATMIPTLSSRRQAILASRMTQLCLNGNTPCVVKLNGVEMDERPVQIEHGDFVRVIAQPEKRAHKRKLTFDHCDDVSLITPPERLDHHNMEDSDEHSLMARAGIRQAVQRQIYLYFFEEDEPFAVNIMQEPSTVTQEEIFRFFRRTFGRDLPENMHLYPLHPQPVDLSSTAAWGVVGREHDTQYSGKVLALIDKQIFDNRFPRRVELPTPHSEWRETMYITTPATRVTFLREIEMENLCSAHPCIVSGPGGLWPTFDVTLRQLWNGAYFVIKARQDLPPQLSSEENDACRRSDEALERSRENAESSEVISSSDFEAENATDIEETNFLQIHMRQKTFFAQRRTSAAVEAQIKLPPPGNGVSFDPEIEELENGMSRKNIDGSIANTFIADLVEECQNDDNIFLTNFLHDLRWNYTNVDTDDVLPAQGRADGQLKSEQAALPILQETNYTPARTDEENATLLSLEKSLGDTFDYATSQSMQSKNVGGIDLAAVWNLFEWISKHFTIGSHEYEAILWKQAALRWMRFPTWNWQKPQELHFYVDGADYGGARGSGCILFVLTEDDWNRGGFAYNANSSAATSFQAELEAHLIASKWEWDILRWCERNKFSPPAVYMHFDNQAAANAVSGKWRCHESQRAYVAARSIQQMIQTQYNVIPEYIHDRSHRGNPGNEAADDIAKWASTQPKKCTFWETFYLTEAQSDLQWLWVLHDKVTKPNLKGPQLVIPKPHASIDQNVLNNLSGRTSEPQDTQAVPWSLKLCSYNVMTLRDEKRGSPGTVESLFQQCHHAGHHIIFLQENRLRRSIHKTNPWYFVLQTSPSKGGSGGLLVGISKTLFLCQDQNQCPLGFKDENLSLIYGDPRLLIAKVDHPGLKTLLINGHLPHTGHDDADVHQWWQRLQDKIPRHLQEHDCIVALDTNARLGSITSEAVGSHAADNQTYGGDLFHQWMKEHSLWVPSTFPETHSGPSFTWTHPTGSTSRIDFLAIPLQWKEHSVCSKVNYAISAHGLLHDHHAVELEITGKKLLQKTGTCQFGRKRCKINFDEPINILKIKEGLKNLHNVSWDTDIHSHVENFNQVLYKASKKVSQTGPQRRKAYLSSTTWQLVLEKKEAKKTFFAQKDLLRKELLASIIAAWKFKGTIPFGLKDLKEHLFKQKSYSAQRSIRNEDEAFFAQFTMRLEQADKPNLQKELWREVQRYLPRNQTRKKQLSTCKHALLQDQWPAYLCELEAGKMTEPATIYGQCLQRQNATPQILPNLLELPTLLQVEQELLATQCHKCGGPDGIVPDILRHCALELATPCWQMMVKQLVWQTEAIQWKGGELKMIPKPHADHTQCTGFRGIMLTSVVGKRCQSLLRKRFVREITPGRPSGQLGGYQHQEALFGAHIVRTNARTAFATKMPFALIFLDLRTAYHHLIRQTVTGCNSDNRAELEQISQNAARYGRPIASLDATFFQKGHLKEIEASDFLHANVHEAQSNTWTWLAGKTIQTTRGSRPGSPLADICFMTSIQEIAQKLSGFLQSIPALENGLARLGIDGSPIYWADDIVIQLTAPTNDELTAIVLQVAAFTHDLFEDRGFEINYGRSKTEVLFTLCGEGAKEHRQTWLKSKEPTCPFYSRGKQRHLRVGACYKHLGSLQESGGELTCEIERRIAYAWSAFRSMRRLLCGSTLSCTTRLRLLQTLIFTKLFYGAGTWFVVPHKALERLSKCYLGLLRCVTKQVFCKGKNETVMSNEALLAFYALPSTRIILARERLLYAFRAWHHGGAALWKAVRLEFQHCPDSWLHGVNADLAWMVEVVGPKWGNTFDEISSTWASLAKNRWKNAVNTAVRRHVLQEQISWKKFRDTFTEPKETVDIDDGWMCFCSAVFSSKRALRTHQTTKHHVRTVEYSFTSDTTCPCCLLQLWTRGRLLQHLRFVGREGKSSRCYSFLLTLQYREDPEKSPPPGTLPLKGLRRRDAIRCQGPLCFGAVPEDFHYAAARVDELDSLLLQQKIDDPLAFVDDTFGAWLENVLDSGEEEWQELAMTECYTRQLDENVFLFTILFIGARFPWRTRGEQEQWKEFIWALPCGELAFEWFDMRLRLALAERVEANVVPMETPQPTANKGERSRRDAKVWRTIILCADHENCPTETSKTLKTLANYRCPTATLKRELAG